MNERWIFADFKLPSERDIRQLHLIKATDVVLGLNDQESKSFKLRWNRNNPRLAAARLVSTGIRLKKEGFRVHLMPWLRPNRIYNEQCAEIVLEAYRAIDADSILFDVEVYWTKRGLARNFDHEGWVDEFWRDLWPLSGIVYGVTSYAIVPRPVVALLNEPEVLYYIPQAYSIYRTKMAWTMGSITIPGDMQQTAFDSWGKFSRDDQRCIMGIPFYSLSRPGMTGLKSLDTTMKKCAELGVPPAGWSLKHTYNKKVQKYLQEN